MMVVMMMMTDDDWWWWWWLMMTDDDDDGWWWWWLMMMVMMMMMTDDDGDDDDDWWLMVIQFLHEHLHGQGLDTPPAGSMVDWRRPPRVPPGRRPNEAQWCCDGFEVPNKSNRFASIRILFEIFCDLHQLTSQISQVPVGPWVSQFLLVVSPKNH